MKKSPEKDLWKSLQSRLSNYAEEPGEDSWDKIVAALPQKTESIKGLLWIDRAVGCGLLLLLFFTSGYVLPAENKVKSNQQIESLPDKTKALESNLAINETSSTTEKSVNEKTEREIYNQTLKSSSTSNVSLSDKSGLDNENKNANKVVHKRTLDISASSLKSNGKRKHSSAWTQIATNTNAENKSSGNLNGSVITNTKVFGDVGNSTVKNIEQTSDDEVIDDKEIEAGPDQDLSRSDLDTGGHNQKFSATASHKVQTQSVDQHSLSGKVKKSDSLMANTSAKEKSIITPVKAKKASQSRVYVVVSPSLSFQKITPSPTDDVVVSALQSPGIFSRSRFGISIDAGLQHSLSKNLEFCLGLSLYQQHQQIVYVYQTPEVSITPSDNGGYTIIPITGSKEFNYAMLNAGASTSLFYRIMGNKLVHKIGAGLQYHKGMLKRTGEESYNNSQSNYLNYQLMYRMEFTINKSVNGFFQPAFTHTLRADEKLFEPFKIKQYKAAIGVGVLYRF
jgi:hypothetical protein